ncbi:hypothetical protein M758_5G147700 [Ceratodon purpureus]|nr:hypothetical protein M758_5G147700 [Ceratodon purpureus]
MDFDSYPAVLGCNSSSCSSPLFFFSIIQQFPGARRNKIRICEALSNRDVKLNEM